MTTKIKSYCMNCKKMQIIIVKDVFINGETKEETMTGECCKCGGLVRDVRRLG